ncbi:DJ-1/PfpI family protein [Nordella sp. HKS 07]|uniref:DJ-1/PfpI family protein n=1 Tax=Nordella sp. HKS 07 TaxID=2712222 RepID=UPI0013E1D87A|nr:DJ-1/PfpI family protein [Nordella sp. HKS 07]QIG50453.1 DJ-1/PfpI family protein [Nordella sp. HKS 07]
MTPHFGILVFPGVQLLDLVGPYEVFTSVPDARVDLVWKDLTPVASSSGLPVTPTATLADCPPLGVLCIPGGGGINALLEDAAVLDFIRTQAAGARFVTSVCTGALVLGAAGLLEGRKATTHWNAFDLLSPLGAKATEGRVVKDGKFITAGGVTSGIDFGLAIVAELYGRKEAETIQLELEYAPEPPFDAGTPQRAGADIVATAKQRMAKMRAEREEIIARRLRSSTGAAVS